MSINLISYTQVSNTKLKSFEGIYRIPLGVSLQKKERFIKTWIRNSTFFEFRRKFNLKRSKNPYPKYYFRILKSVFRFLQLITKKFNLYSMNYFFGKRIFCDRESAKDRSDS